MIELPNNRFIVENVNELPELAQAEELFLDGETTSGKDDEPAFHPYLGHRFCGVAVTADDDPTTWYIPVRHRSPNSNNISLTAFDAWLKHLLAPKHGDGRKRRWINHNVKFDAKFALVEGNGHDPSEIGRQLVDTLTLSKTLDSDREGGHALKALSADWLGRDTSEEEEIARLLRAMKTEDYGRIPVDRLGYYACGDVQHNRELWRYLQQQVPSELMGIWKTEVALTRVLLKVEHRGLPFNREKVQRRRVEMLRTMVLAADRIKAETGIEFSDSSKCSHEIIVGSLNLPILARDPKTKRPTFDADALKLYLTHPLVINSPKSLSVIQSILAYRDAETHKSLFLDAMIRFADANGKVHPNFNQAVRTGGRMSCGEPNEQQWDERAKELIEPEEGHAFACADASQIEFRFIAHHTEDQEAIKAYQENPRTDYHVWVGNMLEADRGLGKTMNFAIAFGAGKARVQQELRANKFIIAAVLRELGPNASAEEFANAVAKRASEVYERYHEKFPGIKRTAQEAEAVCKRRGYIRNAFGRRRHLSFRNSYRAFNTLNQGGAGDYIKDRIVATDEWLESQGVHYAGFVHDEVLPYGPVDAIKTLCESGEYRRLMEIQTVPFSVPFKWNMGWSTKSWLDAKLAAEKDKS